MNQNIYIKKATAFVKQRPLVAALLIGLVLLISYNLMVKKPTEDNPSYSSRKLPHCEYTPSKLTNETSRSTLKPFRKTNWEKVSRTEKRLERQQRILQKTLADPPVLSQYAFDSNR